MVNVMPTFAELQDLSSACNRLWELDSNRLEPDVDYQINLQEGKNAWQHGDVAEDRLFTFVDPCVFERPTYKLLHDLLDNYERGTGIPEDVTNDELAENNAFLNAVIETAPMRYAYNWLTKNKKFTGDMRAFKRKLDYIWFGLYRRQAHNDSSGFEHVFVGEERDGKICGCHNWLQLYNEERIGRLDYRGYIRPKQRGRKFMEPADIEQLVTIQFRWDRELKAVSTSLIGVSPEFEMALYTMCFMNGKEDNIVQLGPYICNIKCFSFGHGDRAKIGTAYPEALPLTEQQAAIKIQAIYRGRHTRQQKQQAPAAPYNPQAWGPPPGQTPSAPPSTNGQPPNAWSKPLPTSSNPQQPPNAWSKPLPTSNDPQQPPNAWSKPLQPAPAAAPPRGVPTPPAPEPAQAPAGAWGSLLSGKGL